MLIYDLICSQGHRFEGWFTDLTDLEGQLGDKSLACPVCGDESVSRCPSVFGLVRSGRPEQQPPVEAQTAAASLSPDQLMGRFIKRWEDFSEKLAREFDDVGSDFTDEALKMHYGVTAPRNIRGQSTEDQDMLLKKEGVTVYKLPLIRRGNTSTGTSN